MFVCEFVHSNCYLIIVSLKRQIVLTLNHNVRILISNEKLYFWYFRESHSIYVLSLPFVIAVFALRMVKDGIVHIQRNIHIHTCTAAYLIYTYVWYSCGRHNHIKDCSNISLKSIITDDGGEYCRLVVLRSRQLCQVTFTNIYY